MKVKDLGEFGLLAKIAPFLPCDPRRVIKGIGDDAAVIDLGGDRVLVATADMLVEDRHFSLQYTDGWHLGIKAMEVNISDIAAMGAVPLYALVSLGLPPATDVEFVEELYQGMACSARERNISIVGGDTVRAEKIVINITLLGEGKKGQIVFRSGARPGDVVAVTGPLGRSAAGLFLLQNREKLQDVAAEIKEELISAHLAPRARLREGLILANSGAVTAMNDISDGLAREVTEICLASRTGCRLKKEKIPVAIAACLVAEKTGQDPVAWALGGGEDYELVFTVKPERLEEIKKVMLAAGRTIFPVGEITGSGEIILESEDREDPLFVAGYDHFKEGF